LLRFGEHDADRAWQILKETDIIIVIRRSRSVHTNDDLAGKFLRWKNGAERSPGSGTIMCRNCIFKINNDRVSAGRSRLREAVRPRRGHEQGKKWVAHRHVPPKGAAAQVRAALSIRLGDRNIKSVTTVIAKTNDCYR
jgi:hypothetical protein